MRDDGVITASAYLGTFKSVNGPDFFFVKVWPLTLLAQQPLLGSYKDLGIMKWSLDTSFASTFLHFSAMRWSGIVAVTSQIVSFSPKWDADKYISVLQFKIFLSFMHCIFQKPDYFIVDYRPL